MKEAFEDWDPKPESLRLLREIGRVLAQYKTMGLRLTLRQLFYQLVSQNIIANTERSYKNLGNLLSKARMAGMIDWDIIEDRARHAQRHPEWSGIPSLIESAVSSFRLPRWQDQEVYVELWCEKDALTSVLKPICWARHVTLMVQRGYGSTSAMYESAKRIMDRDHGNEVNIIYLGDLDPSGEDMVRDVRERLEVFMGEDAQDLTVSKLALDHAQVSRYKLPPNPLKRDASGYLTDSRGAGFAAQHGNQSYEVDALPPEVLQSMVLEAIESRTDMAAYDAMVGKEEALKAKLVDAGKKIK